MASVQEFSAVRVKFSNNVQATLSVKLINGDNENPAQVYGNISARFNASNQVMVFDKARYQYIDIRPGQNIPLSRSDVSVPLSAKEFEVEAYLMDFDTLSPADEIANGKALFPVRATGQSDRKIINGKYGSIEANVRWG